MTPTPDPPLYMRKKQLPDGRMVFLYRQFFNWKLTVGYGEMTWDESY